MMLMQEQMVEENKKESTFNKVFWIIYMILVYALIGLTGARWAALFAHFRWRMSTTSFPTACPGWSTRTAAGCTRFTLQ